MRKVAKQTITSLSETISESLGMEILEIRFVPQRKRSEVRIVLDRLDRPVNITDCTEFSRKLSRILDVEDPIEDPYVLHVSSPGFKRLIRIPVDLPRFLNHRVKVRLTEPVLDQKVWTGNLLSDSDPFKLNTEEKGELEIAFDNVVQINLHE